MSSVMWYLTQSKKKNKQKLDSDEINQKITINNLKKKNIIKLMKKINKYKK